MKMKLTGIMSYMLVSFVVSLRLVESGCTDKR